MINNRRRMNIIVFLDVNDMQVGGFVGDRKLL